MPLNKTKKHSERFGDKFRDDVVAAVTVKESIERNIDKGETILLLL